MGPAPLGLAAVLLLPMTRRIIQQIRTNMRPRRNDEPRTQSTRLLLLLLKLNTYRRLLGQMQAREPLQLCRYFQVWMTFLTSQWDWRS